MEAASALHPSSHLWLLCIILAGSNDLVQGVSAGEKLAGVSVLHAACDAAHVPTLVVINPDIDTANSGLMPGPAKAVARHRNLAEFCCMLEEWCVDSGRAVVDVRAALPMMDAKHGQLWD